MQIVIASASKDPDITLSVLERIAAAMETQLYAHVGGLWQGGGAKVSVAPDLKSIPEGDGICPLPVFDHPDQPGALGWHTYDPLGRIYGAIFWEPIRDNGGTLIEGPDSLSTTLSHEGCEALCDPYVNDVSFVGQDGKLVEWKEVCDRTQGDVYEEDGVTLSNFLGPRAFRDGPGPYDYLRLLKDPWEVRPAGYVQRLEVSTGTLHTVWGPEMKEWKRELVKLKLQKNLSRLARRHERTFGRTLHV